MKKYILLAGALFMGAFITQAQENSFNINFINLESGINLSQFNFSDSEVESAFKNGDYSPSQHQAVSVGFSFFKEDLNLVLGAAYDKHQVIGKSIDMSSSHLSYDLNYVTASLGLEYSFPVQDKVNLLLNGGVAYNYLLSGFQNMGSSTYDLADSDFEDNNYSYSVGAGLLYQMTDATGIYLKYDWSNTLDKKEAEDPNESYKLTSYVFSVGVRFNLAN
jgi:opacity protein-like surface antigen